MPNDEKSSLCSKDRATKLTATNLYFKNLIDLVPPQAYFDVESKEILSNHKVSCEISQANGKKLKTHTDRKNEKHLNKKAKLNPKTPTKTSELQQILPQLKEQTANVAISSDLLRSSTDSSVTVSQRGDKQKAPPALHSNRVENCNGDVENAATKAKLKRTKQVAKHLDNAETNEETATAVLIDASNSSPDENFILTEADSSGTVSKHSPAGTVDKKLHPDELREKLRARILELQQKRQKGMTAEEFLESKKLRRKQSKFKLKQKRKEAKKLKLSIEKQAKNNQQKLNGLSEVKDDAKASGASSIVFSKFEFSEQSKKPKEKKIKKPKSYKELYEKVTKDKAQLEELHESNPDKAKKMAEKNAWRKAMDQSKGVKVKDNPELIKRSMKREEKLKQRSQKKWEERKASVADQQQKRQDKRKKNILAKKQTKSDRKIKLAKKKGRIVSGF
ncbi:surfeit locus protein 6 homolog [Watersipora subatra]|uniref:surfeit locus protein 6 homolog n=1 Tax=Watersipora subatra TaxID=2589382 RepID=UPI00355B05CE